MSARPVKRLALTVARRLDKAYPDSDCSLPQDTTFKLLIAVILSAQCTDERVMMTTPGLFAVAPDAPSMAALPESRIKELIASVGLTNSKARNLKATSRILVEEYGGEVPETMDELIRLPGVGRKTANVVMGVAFGTPSLVVDTHVTRISNLLGLVNSKDPVKIEMALREQLPKKWWTPWAHLLISHGRAVCIARRPQCESCCLSDICPSAVC